MGVTNRSGEVGVQHRQEVPARIEDVAVSHHLIGKLTVGPTPQSPPGPTGDLIRLPNNALDRHMTDRRCGRVDRKIDEVAKGESDGARRIARVDAEGWPTERGERVAEHLVDELSEAQRKRKPTLSHCLEPDVDVGTFADDSDEPTKGTGVDFAPILG